MRQKITLLTRTMLLLCALVAGSGSAWAEEVITWEKVTNYSSLSTSDTYVIAGNKQGGSTWYSLKNNQVSTAAYLSTGSTLTISDNKITSTISSDETWVLETTGTTGQYYIKSTKGDYYLQNANNTKSTIKTKSSTDNQNKWQIHYEDSYTTNQNVTYTVTGLYNVGASRTLAFYGGGNSNDDWRCYGNSNYNNIDGAEVVLFKRVVTDSSSPAINATNPAKLAYNATSGEISYTIDNPVDGASVSANTEAEWISSFSYATAGKVTYTIGKNTTLEDRNATVTLTYKKDETTYATKNVTVSQGHLDVSAPNFNPVAGTYNAAQNVTLEGPANSTIYYTTDGSNPTTSSSPYSSAISVNVSQTLKAIAVVDGVSSTVAEAEYVLKLPITIAPNGATFEESQEVTLSSVDGATIKYTLDNSDPTGEGALTYSEPFTLTATKTVKAVATKTGWTNSDVATATFTKIDPNDVWVKTGLSALTTDDVFVIVGEKTVDNTTTTHAMSNDKGTGDGPDAIAVTISNNMISGTVANKIKWNVSRSNDGYTFYPNGSTTTWLYCTGSNDGVRIGTSDDKNFTISSEGYLYNTGRSCYVGIYNSSDWRRYSTINANISGQSFATYKHGISVTLAAACTDGEKYYSTFCSSVPFKVPADVTVSEIGIDANGKLNVQNYATGDVVPANTGVMISSTTAGKKTFTPASGGTSVLGVNNRLRPSGFAISDITATTMSTADASCKYYRLTMHNGSQIGFWWGAADGAAFSLAANKAYLAVPVTAARLQGLWFGDEETTGVNEVRSKMADVRGEVYNLNGQRVEKPTKGLYIVNGKKVIVK